MGWNNLLLRVFQIIFIFILLICIFSSVDNSYCNAKNILYVGGSGQGNFSLIQNAFNEANPNDTILIFPGIYYENLVINKSIEIIGIDRNNTIINGMDNLYTIYLNSDNIIISNCTVKNSKAAIYISGSSLKSIVIEENVILDSDEAIHVYNSSKITISNNDFLTHGAGGIFFWNCSDSTIDYNYMFKNKKSINLLRGSKNNTIANNNISKSSIGICFEYSSNNYAFDNVIDRCENGIKLYFSNNNTIIRNFISNCKSYGIYYSYSNDNIFDSNVFLDNKEDFKEEAKPPVIRAPGFELVIILFAMLLIMLMSKKNL